MNRSRRRRLALRVLAVMIGLGAIGAGGIASAQVSGSVTITPGTTVIAPSSSSSPSLATPNDVIWT